MKKVFFVCLMAAAAVMGFAASEDLDMYASLYDSALTPSDQLALIQVVESQQIEGAGEFYARALNRLVLEYQNIRSATDRGYAEEQTILLAKLLGDEKYTGGASDLWRVVISFSNPLVRAEALMSLGKMRATAFLPQVIKVLSDLNERPISDRLNGERVAYGAIIALEKYQDISGYLPVYFASIGWYSERIKSQAVNSMRVISADPTDPMIEVINGSAYNYETKLAALQTVNAADVSGDSKSRAALAGFTEGWRSATRDVRLQGQLNVMRKLAMRMIRENGCSDDAVYDLLDQSYHQYARSATGDRDESIDAIITLRTLATEQAADKLAAFLMVINGKRQYGTATAKDENLIREIIPALGATKQARGRLALRAVTALDWTPSVITLAQDALKQIP